MIFAKISLSQTDSVEIEIASLYSDSPEQLQEDPQRTCGEIAQVAPVVGQFAELLSARVQNGEAEAGLGEQELGHGAHVRARGGRVAEQLENIQDLDLKYVHNLHLANVYLF